MIGAAAGGGKGALIGGPIGAAAGTVAALFTGRKDVRLPAETRLTFDLTEPLKINAKSRSSNRALRRSLAQRTPHDVKKGPLHCSGPFPERSFVGRQPVAGRPRRPQQGDNVGRVDSWSLEVFQAEGLNARQSSYHEEANGPGSNEEACKHESRQDAHAKYEAVIRVELSIRAVESTALGKRPGEVSKFLYFGQILIHLIDHLEARECSENAADRNAGQRENSDNGSNSHFWAEILPSKAIAPPPSDATGQRRAFQ